MDTTAHVHDSPSRTPPVIDWPAPERVCIPLRQHQGKAAAVIVTIGQAVNQGQLLTHSDNLFEVPVHASISGIVDTITAQQITLRQTPNGDAQTGSITRQSQQPQGTTITTLYNGWSRSEYLQRIHNAGLVGLGGSCYPVAAKINKLGDKPADTLLINAAECDPSICCDEALLNHSIDEIAMGICLAQHATQAKKTIIGIESDKSALGQLLLTSVLNCCAQQFAAHTELQVVPASYPNGAESLLMSHCVGRTLTPTDIHESQLITFNINTCYSLSQALILGNPCTHRIATIIDSQHNRFNLRLPLGTPISDLIAYYEQRRDCTIVVGGEMMGTEVGLDAVVTKASNCIQLKYVKTQPTVRPCVRCSLCVDACPVSLKPQLLLSAASTANYTNLQTLNLQNCIECTCCDRACPSHIPLAGIFAKSKEQMRQDTHARQMANLAKARYEKRQARLENSKQREFKKLDKKQSNLNQPEKAGQQAKRKLVEEALQRARDKKKNQPPANNNTSPADGQS